MLNIIKELYAGSKSAVWNGEVLSDFFDVDIGVKQGCLLSPILFSLFLNDIDKELKGGVQIGNILIKVLLYADDIVLLADDANTLQTMINDLKLYCTKWNLTVNLAKSNIMVFRKGPRLRTDERWHFGDQNILLVNEYKYLGVLLTYNLSYNKHLDAKLTCSKNAINMTWSDFIKNQDILPSAKFNIFNAASRSIMCYAAQVWGYKPYEQVEKLQRFFLKKMYFLPANTPNYMLHLETGLYRMFLYTLPLHFGYVQKIL